MYVTFLFQITCINLAESMNLDRWLCSQAYEIRWANSSRRENWHDRLAETGHFVQFICADSQTWRTDVSGLLRPLFRWGSNPIKNLHWANTVSYECHLMTCCKGQQTSWPLRQHNPPQQMKCQFLVLPLSSLLTFPSIFLLPLSLFPFFLFQYRELKEKGEHWKQAGIYKCTHNLPPEAVVPVG